MQIATLTCVVGGMNFLFALYKSTSWIFIAFFAVCDMSLCREPTISCTTGTALVKRPVPGSCCPDIHCGNIPRHTDPTYIFIQMHWSDLFIILLSLTQSVSVTVSHGLSALWWVPVHSMSNCCYCCFCSENYIFFFLPSLKALKNSIPC